MKNKKEIIEKIVLIDGTTYNNPKISYKYIDDGVVVIKDYYKKNTRIHINKSNILEAHARLEGKSK